MASQNLKRNFPKYSKKATPDEGALFATASKVDK